MRSLKMKACVVIPTYNEAKAVGGLVREVCSQNLGVIVIDDGSEDDTSRVAGESGAQVLRNQNNEGKGASLIKGFNYVLAEDFDVVITMDGDGQHEPSDIPYFMRLAEYSDSGIFIGNRMLKTSNMPLVRFLTNKFMSWLISSVSGQKIPDTQCGFRLIKKDVLRKLNLRTTKYETESELLIQASRLGFKIESVPIKTIYNREKSRIHPVIDTLRFIRFMVRELWTTQY